MWIAAYDGNVDLLNMLIDAGGDVNIANVVSLLYHTCNCLHSKLKYLIDIVKYSLQCFIR